MVRHVTIQSLGGLELVQGRYRGDAFALHAHSEFVIGLVVDGAKSSRLGRRTFEVGAGTLTLFNPFEEHTSKSLTDSWAYIALYPTIEMIDKWFEPSRTGVAAVRLKRPVVSDPVGARLIERLCNLLHPSLPRLSAEVMFVDAMTYFVGDQALHSTRCARAIEPRLRRVRDFLDHDLGANVGLSNLADVSGLPPVTVLRHFRTAYGCTPRVYRTARRLAAAKRALLEGQPVAQIAAGLGFTDQSHLNKVFRMWTGTTPAAFRLQN